MGVILSAFLLPKMVFWGDLGCFEGLDGEIVRSDGGKHIQAFLRESFGRNMRILQLFEVVEIFDHILLLFVCQLDNISVWKLLWIVLQSFIDTSGLHSIQLGNVSIEDHTLLSDEDNLVFCLFNIFFLSHIVLVWLQR